MFRSPTPPTNKSPILGDLGVIKQINLIVFYITLQNTLNYALSNKTSYKSMIKITFKVTI